MKNPYSRNLLVFSIFAGLGALLSCSEDDGTPAPEADFTFEVNGKTLAVTDASLDAVSYAWDFGDGNSSTETSPTHTYEANGSYVVSLTVTNETGSDDKSVAIEVINISIDGDFTDWDDVPSAISYVDGEGGIALELKVENLEDDRLFMYIKTSEQDSTGGFITLYMNSDNDDATGFSSWYWPTTPGFDILIEGFLTSAGADEGYFYGKFMGTDQTAFSWEQLTASSTFLTGSEQKSVTGGKAFEFSIALSEFPPGLVPTEKVKIGMDFIYTVDTWVPLNGTIPTYGEETSAAYEYTLKQ